MGAALLTSCGPDDTTGTTPEPAKTLVRASLYDTDWYPKGGGLTHQFMSDGTYGNLGTWKWLGNENSDSMQYTITSTSKSFVLYFKYSEDTEMACQVGKPANENDYQVFKSSPW
jgi:hypothetical protein